MVGVNVHGLCYLPEAMLIFMGHITAIIARGQVDVCGLVATCGHLDACGLCSCWKP